MKHSKVQVVVFVAAIAALIAIPCLAESHVRIVRLSEIEGSVQINRNLHGYEKAFLNLPVTEGNEVRTQSDSRAEIEFEDGSALRLAPDTTVGFPQLSLNDSGIRISDVNVKAGTAYVDFKNAKNDQFTLTFGQEKIVLTRAAHLRINLSDKHAEVAVFSGEADVVAPSGTVEVSKNRTAIFDLSDKNPERVAKSIEPEPFDAWDKQQDQYQQRYSANSPVASSSPYAYGLSDLSYYGSFSNLPGYGLMWQPYFAGANWDPFMDGAWAFYPGMGYGWVSAYPWGWTPFHSGNWTFINGRGWAWSPGSTWTAVNAQPRVANAPASFVAPKPPAVAGQSLVVVNRGPVATFAGHSTNQMIIRNDSAGLGIPRGEVNDLSRISQRVSTHGTATARVHSAPVQSAPAGNWGRSDSSMSGTGRSGRLPSAASSSSANHGGSMGTMHSSAPPASAPAGRNPK